MKFTFSILFTLVVFLSGCMQQTQHVQVGNPTGKVDDNKWDYYNGTPIHYTSFQRTVIKEGITTINEATDAFSGIFNLSKINEKGSVVFGDRTVILSLSDENDFALVSGWEKEWIEGYDRLYLSSDQKVYVGVNDFKQIIVLGYLEDSENNDIAYLPSRYLACKKISMMQQAANAAIMAELVSTALVAGVQSYTSYSTTSSQGNISSQYGNFGYMGTSTTRDYSWAGDRASDALDTVFSGNANMQTLNAAWDSMNCY